MKNILKFLVISFLLLNLLGCKTYNYNEKPKEFKLYIDKIGLDMEYEILSLNDTVYGIVMFDECGRPDIDKSNTVIGAHSGNAANAYFNDIYKLEKNDTIEVIYNKKEYVYIVDEIKEVNDTDVDILEDRNKSMLTLLTCKIGDVSKRIIVVAYLTNGKN